MLQFPQPRFDPRRRSKTSRTVFAYRFLGMLAIVLAALVFFAPFSRTGSAQTTGSGSKQPPGDYFILYRSADGEAVCREATAAERAEFRETDPRTLRQINHLESESSLKGLSATTGENDLPAHLTINLRATAQLDANTPAKDAFIRAAATWENQIKSPVTIYIDVDFGPTNFGNPWPPNVLGSTQSPSISSLPYSQVRNNLIASASTPAETTAYNALPATQVPTDLGDVNTVSMSSSIARALGFLDPTAQPTDLAAKIGFNSAFSYDFDPSNGISGGTTDFEAVATHEIGHALGFTSRAGSTSGTPPPPTSPSMWDLFRFRTGTTAGTFTTAPRIMTIGGPDGPSSGYLQYFYVPGVTDVVPYLPLTEAGLSTGGPSGATTTNGDGNQSSHWKQAALNPTGYIGIMDPKIPSGTRRVITQYDTDALNSFGYNLNNSNPPPPPPPPPPAPANDNFASAQVISGCTGSVSGTNVGATHEASEPSHDPLGNPGASSVWYQWQAPSGTSVTITTAGSNYDTMLGVYTGTSVSGLTSIAKNDDVDTNAGILTSSVTFTATAGTTYRIAVDGWGGDAGNIVLNWTQKGCLLIEEGTTNQAAALDSVTQTRGPFSKVDLYNFSSDQRTRLMFFTTNLGQNNSTGLSVQIGGISVPIENVGTVPGQPQFSQIVVMLTSSVPTGPAVNVTVTLNGTSNIGTVNIIP
ncbi:MAG TPA: NF038122 family metalloprotease [Pyrinomonadaceae bacterium]|jgi:hypothetical protein